MTETVDASTHKPSALTTLCLLSILMSLGSSIQFSIQIDDEQTMCFSHLIITNSSDYAVAESTPFHFGVEADHPEFTLSLLFQDGTPLVKLSEPNPLKKIDSYAAVTDHYNFCIENQSDDQEFIISFFHGLELSDIAALPKEEDHHLIDKLVDELNSVYQSVRSQEQYMKTVNEYNMELQKLVSFKYVGFGFLSITVVLIISFLHYLEIKRVLRTRKVI